MRATRLSEIREWNRSLVSLRDTRYCPSPGFFKPYHFVTIALMLKEQGAGFVNLPPEITSYAARMRLWEAIGLESPVSVEERPSSTRFHELTRLSDLAAVGDVSEALSRMVTENVGKPCTAETQESLFITLTELLGNCHHHARAKDDLHGLVCAQTWYRGARAQFAIADSGIGIRQSLGENPDLANRLATQNACSLATQLGISSKLNRGHAGYGLAVARDLALQTPGAQLFVQSLNEAVMIGNGQIFELDKFEHAIPGTLVVFEWDTKKPLDISSVYTQAGPRQRTMMMTSSNFEVRTQVPDTTTRPNGAAAREKLKASLVGSDNVVVDMTDIVLTPSFADEFLGVLLAELGEDNFRRAIKIVNVSETSRPLLQTVLHRRASNPRPPQPPLHVAHA